MATTTGTSGNDSWIVVKAGTFTLDGLGGTDTLALGTSLRSEYTIRQVGTAVLVDSISGASSALHATLYNMETLTFNSGRDVVDLTTYFKPAAVVTTLNGSGLNDTFALGIGNYNVYGVGGLDTATVAQTSSNFNVSPSTSGYTLTSKDGLSVYNLNSVERVSFSNEKIAFDVAGTSNAGEVAKILGAVFGAAAVGNTTYAGIGLSFLDGGMSYENLMNLAISAALPGARLTNKAVVDLLFTNVVGVVPTVDQAKPYLDLLDNHTFTVAQLGVLAADSSFNTNQIGLTGQLVQTGLHYV
jgi:hypothetical protein